MVGLLPEVRVKHIETDKQLYHRDEKVRVTAYVYDESYAPVGEAKLKAQVSSAETKQDQSGFSGPDLRFASDGNGRYSAEFVPVRDGQYRIDACWLLGELVSTETIELLLKLVNSDDEQIKEEAFAALVRLSDKTTDPELKDIISHIIETSDVQSEWVVK